MAIFNSAGSGNANADATWTEAGQPAAGDHAIIASGHTVTLTADEAWGSCRVNGTLAGNYTVTLNDGGNSAILHNDGTINDTPNFTITGGTNREIKNDGSSTLGTVTINSSGQTFTLAGPNTHTWEALTITAGTLTTLDGSTNRNLTVTGDVSVTGTLTGNASAISMGSLTILDGGTYSATSGTTTLTSENSSGYCWWQSGGTLTHNNGTVKYTGSADTVMRGQGFYNLILEGSSSSVDLYVRPHDNVADGNGVFTIANDLTIVEGVFRRNYQPNQLVVTGDVSVESGGTLGTTDATGPNTFGSLTIASGGTYSATSGTTTLTADNGASPKYCFKNAGTFTPNAGLVMVESPNAHVLMEGGGIHDLTIAAETHNTTGIYWNTNPFVVTGVLTIEAGGSFATWAGGYGLTVTEDVSVSGILGSSNTGAYSFGSLTIASGGTYKATSDTTTITSMTSTGSGDRSLSLVSGGTFTNNSGTVLFNSGADQRLQMAGTGNLYNLTVNKSDNEFITFGNLTILNNLDVTLAADHTWRPNAGSDTLTVYGNTYLTTGKIGNTTQYTGTNNWGNVTINSGEFILSTGTNNVSGIRNVGGTVSQS